MQAYRIVFAGALAVCGVSLLACGKSAIKTETAAVTTHLVAAGARVSGFAVCAACGVGAVGDQLEVQVIDPAADTAAPLIAEFSVDASRDRRMPFALTIDPRWTTGGRTLALRATLRDASGRLRASTARKVALPTASNTAIELPLDPVSAR